MLFLLKFRRVGDIADMGAVSESWRKGWRKLTMAAGKIISDHVVTSNLTDVRLSHPTWVEEIKVKGRARTLIS